MSNNYRYIYLGEYHMRKITKIITPIVTSSILGSAALIGFSSLHAAGGGGGGGGSSGSAPSQSTPRYDAAAEYQKGVNALQAREYKKATRAFKRTISVAPKNAQSHYFLGVSYMGLENYKKARKSLEKAIRYNANMVEAHRDLAISYHKLDEPEKAQSALNDLMSLQERCAGTCADNAKLSDAISNVKSTLNGDQAVSINNHEILLADKINVKNSDKLYVAAVALINEKKYDDAITQLNIAAKTFGPHPDILTYLGFANRKLQKFDTAETYYKRALAVAPDHLGANEYFGELMVERGDIKGAKSQLAKLDALCDFGCYEAEELRRWIDTASIS